MKTVFHKVLIYLIPCQLISLATISQHKDQSSFNLNASSFIHSDNKVGVSRDFISDEEFEKLKENFRSDLESQLEKKSLAELDEEDLQGEVDYLIHVYERKAENSILKKEDYLKELEGFGKNEVAKGWLSHEIQNARIFNEYPPSLYEDKLKLEECVRELKTIDDRKKCLVEEWDLNESSLNVYHKYLNGQINIDELEKELKNARREGFKRKDYRELNRKIKKLEKQENQIKNKLDQNEFLRYIQTGNPDAYKGEGSIDYLNLLNTNSSSIDLNTLLNNDFISNYISENQPNPGKVSAGIINKEVLKALDSTDVKWMSQYQDLREKSGKLEVQDYPLKDTDAKTLLPRNVFFEGIVAFAKSSDHSVFSISPNIGKRFNNGISGGFGLTLHHNNIEDASIQTALDYKAFLKYEFIKNMFFIQTEYIAMIPGISYVKTAESISEFNDTILIGGGFNIKLKGKKALSLGLMYNLDQDLGLPTYQSPLLARFGIKLF